MSNAYDVAFYLRLSKEDCVDNDESNSIANQRMYLTGYLEKSDTLQAQTISTYCDDGYSGTNFTRPQFQKMMQDVSKGLINCIIVKDFSRFAREYMDITDFLTNFFPLMEVRFISINDNFDSLYDDPTSLDISFRNLMYDCYSKDLSENVRLGVYNKMKQGNFIGSKPPYGYKIDNSGSIRKLVIDEESAAIVKQIYQLVLSGFTAIETAKILNDDNVQTPSQYMSGQGYRISKGQHKGYWSKMMVRNIIKNEEYTGKVVNAKKMVKKIGSNAYVALPKENRIIIENAHSPIISESEFQKANECLTLNYRKFYDDKERKKVFLKKIKCACCGYSMTRLSSEKGRYICQTEKVKFFENCVREYVHENIIENAVISELNQYISLLSERHNKRLLMIEKAKKEKAQAIKSIKFYKRTLQKYEKTKLKTYEDYLDEKISRLDYEQRKTELDVNISDTQAYLHNLEQLAEYDESTEKPLNTLLEHYLNRKPITNLDKQTADDLVDKILIHSPDKIEIIWRFKNPFD